MKFKAVHTTDSIGRTVIFEEGAPRRRMLPQTDDKDLIVSTKKHGDITLAALKKKDPEYLVWLVSKSKQTKTIKYAAIRLIRGLPYEVPAHNHTYAVSLFFDSDTFKSYADQLGIQITE